MKLNLTELSSSLKKLRIAQKEKNYSILVANVFATLMRKNMNYSVLSFCRSDQEAKAAYCVIMRDAAWSVKLYLSELQLQKIPISKQDELVGKIMIGERQLQRITQLRKTYPLFAFNAQKRLKKQARKISEQEFDSDIWLSYLDRQCKESNSQTNILAELSKYADNY